jgi:WS/DGAT/MGAT family acyltransferase
MQERLSPFESIMWRVGQDPTLRLTVGTLLILDQPPKEAELVERVSAAIERIPRLQWRPDDPTFSRIRPVWVEEADFDGQHHVRSTEVAQPGSLRQVLDMLSLLEVVPFDPERSPWDLTLIQGLEGGRAAVYLRAHHVLTDGIGGVRLVEELFDRPEPEKPERKPRSRPRAVEEVATEDDAEAVGAQRRGTVTIDLTRVVRPLSAGMNAARDAQPLDTAVRGFQRALDLANSVSRQVMVTGGPLSPAPPAHSVLSRFDVMSVSGAREAALALGGSRNDLLVMAAAGALGLYFDRLGQPCPRLRVGMPARQLRDGDFGGNWFAPTRVEVSTATDHPARRFGVVAERLAQARHEPAVRMTATLAAAISRLPNRVLLPALHVQADTIDLAVTAVPGLRGESRLCGAKVEAAYPMGPRLGIPLNVTAFASDGGLDVGIALDPASIADPDAFRDCLVEVLGRLVPVGASPTPNAT